MTEEFIIGDSRPFIVDLKINSLPFVIDPLTTTIKASITSKDRTTSYVTTPITVDTDYTGTDLSISKIVVKFPRSSTSTISQQGAAFLEIQLSTDNIDPALDPDDTTWFIPITLVKGRIP